MQTNRTKKIHSDIPRVLDLREGSWDEYAYYDVLYSHGTHDLAEREITYIVYIKAGSHIQHRSLFMEYDRRSWVHGYLEDLTGFKEREPRLKTDMSRREFQHLNSEITEIRGQIEPLNEQITSLDKKVNLIIKNLKTRGIDLSAPSILERLARKIKKLLGFENRPFKYKEPRILPFPEAKAQVEDYIAEYFDVDEVVFPSDIAEALNLDYNLVFDIFNELKKEMKLE